MFEPFSAEWVAAVARELGVSESFRRASGRWEGDLVLRVGDAAPAKAVYVDLHHGVCREARLATEGDLTAARYVLAGSQATWNELLAGELAAATAVLGRRLEIERGGMFSLLPHLAAAQELLAAGVRVTQRARAAVAPTIALTPIREEAASLETAQESGERVFRTTSARGLDRDSFPMKLWEKAKRDGIWNPSAIDFRRDREDWLALAPRERQILLHLSALLCGGEESVALDLLPLVETMAREGRLEEEMFLTAFLWEEAKHTDAMRRLLDEVAEAREDLSHFEGPSYRAIFHHALPEAMRALRQDASPEAQARASVTYNLVVEGVLAETSYFAYQGILTSRGILPGTQQLIGHLKQDESRHLAYGVYLLSRLVAEHGEAVWQAIRSRMEELFPHITGIIKELFARYQPDIPFHLNPETFLDYATRQYEKRLARIELARGGRVELGEGEE